MDLKLIGILRAVWHLAIRSRDIYCDINISSAIHFDRSYYHPDDIFFLDVLGGLLGHLMH